MIRCKRKYLLAVRKTELEFKREVDAGCVN